MALTAMRRFQSSSEVRATGIEAAAPALLTSTATGPSSAASRERASTLASLVTSQTTALASWPRATSSAALPLDLVATPGGDHHTEAGVRQRPGGGGSDPAAGAGHHGHPAGQGIHVACPVLAPSSAWTASSRIAPRTSMVARPSSAVAWAGYPK